jgi:hypothetical protein
MHRLWNGRARLFLIAALVLLGLVLGLLFGVLPAWEPADDGLLAGDPSGLGLRTDEEEAADRRREDALTLHGREAAGQPGPGPTDGGRGPAAEPPPGPAEIVVLSAETLAPLEGAHFLDERGERDLAEKGVEGSTSDEDGRIALEQVPVTGVSVRLTKPGYLPGVVKVRAGERVEAELLPGVPVRGRILRVGATKGSNAAEVFVWEEDLGVEIASFSTDETGAFELSAVRPNRPFLMTVRLPGLVPSS